MKSVFITIVAAVSLTVAAVVYCDAKHKEECINYRSELQEAISRTSGDAWDVIEIRGEQMTVEYALSIVDYIDANY